VRALVIGASGQVGAALIAALRARGHEAIGTYATRPAPEASFPLDLRDPAAVEHAIAFAKPDWIFCPAALSWVDYCEDHEAEALLLNRDAPLAAARLGRRLVGAGFVYYSSDYVFDGRAGPYDEDAPPRPLGAYGRSKLAGEQALRELPRTLVLRTSVVYGPERQEKNFVYQMLRSFREGRPLRPARDQRASPTYNPDLAQASVELAEQERHGLFHVAGGAVLDRLEFTLLICRTFGLDAGRLRPALTAELGQKAARPLAGGLRVDRAQALVSCRLRPPAEGLAAMRRALDEAAARAGAEDPTLPPPGGRAG
jgi:dTDP-4-dehydrorhamnose reductase